MAGCSLYHNHWSYVQTSHKRKIYIYIELNPEQIFEYT